MAKHENGEVNLAKRVVPGQEKVKPAGYRPLYVAMSWSSHPWTLFHKGNDGHGKKALWEFIGMVGDAMQETDVLGHLIGARALGAEIRQAGEKGRGDVAYCV